jgi:hypothetical protein
MRASGCQGCRRARWCGESQWDNQNMQKPVGVSVKECVKQRKQSTNSQVCQARAAEPDWDDAVCQVSRQLQCSGV